MAFASLYSHPLEHIASTLAPVAFGKKERKSGIDRDKAVEIELV